MWRWMTGLLRGRPRELPLAKRDLLVHAHVDMLPTRWTAHDVPDDGAWLGPHQDQSEHSRRHAAGDVQRPAVLA
jgi:hypothetical protein